MAEPGRPRILLIGRNGQLAWELRRTLACIGEVVAVDRQSSPVSIDLADGISIRDGVREVRPDLIVNAAAFTAVDRAEEERDLAYAVNGLAPGLLAESARGLGAGLVHFSTDYVFSGQANQPYTEKAVPDPRSTYGHSKLQGERAIQQVGVAHFILRTAWVYGGRRNNFLRTMLRLMAERESLGIVDDQVGCPSWVREIAQCTAVMVARGLRGARFDPGQDAGIFHMACAGQASWFGFAEKIRQSALGLGLLPAHCARLHGISSDAYPTAARRPAWSVLCCGRLRSRFGLRLSGWETALDLCLQDLQATSLVFNDPTH